MDPLALYIQSLSEKEFLLIQKTLKKTPRKMELVRLLRNNSAPGDGDMQKMGYGNGKNAYYTLKHRLLQDIISFRHSLGKNEFILLKERVDNLRILLYSREHPLLEKELKDLEQKCILYEYNEGLYEVYFCAFMLYYYNPQLQKKYRGLLVETEKKTAALKKMEWLFFEIIFEFQDLYFSEKNYRSPTGPALLKELEDTMPAEGSKIGEFFIYSAYLTLCINIHTRDAETAEKMELWLRRVSNLFLYPSVQLRYPNLKFAIDCLLNKYYTLSGNREMFEESLFSLRRSAPEIRGYKPYEKVYFYFLYSFFAFLTERGEYEKAYQFIREEISDLVLYTAGERMRYYLYHMLGVAAFNTQRFGEAEKQFLKARQHNRFITESAHWIVLENSILNIICRALSGNAGEIEHEAALFRKELKRLGLYGPLYRSFIRAAASFPPGGRMPAEAREWLRRIHEENGLLYEVRKQ